MEGSVAKRCANVAFLAMLVLALGAVWYYKERMIFTDASLVSFRRINLQDLESSQRRWGAFITECVPLLLSKLHVPLRPLLVAYSLSFNLFYLGVTGLLIYRWRYYSLGILMSCYYLLFVSAGYFWTNNEIHQAVAYIFLCLGVSYRMAAAGRALVWQYVAFVLLSGLAIFTHPLAIIAFIFLWVALWQSDTEWPLDRRRSWHFLAIVMVWALVKLLLSNSQAYDARRMHGLTHPTKDLLLGVFSGKVAHAWYEACVINYWLPMLLAGCGLIIMIWRRHWMAALWVVASGTGLVALVHFGFPEGHFFYYLEGEWQTLGLIVGVPLVYYLLPSVRRQWALVIFGVLVAVRIGYIVHAARPFTERVAFIESLNDYARTHKLSKMLVKASNSRFEERLFMDWGLATESMTLSAIAGDRPQYTICSLWPDHPERIPEGNKEMVWNFDKRPASALNAYYFQLDTTRPYTVVAYDSIESKLR